MNESSHHKTICKSDKQSQYFHLAISAECYHNMRILYPHTTVMSSFTWLLSPCILTTQNMVH